MMSSSPPLRAGLQHFTETITVAALGGATLTVMGFPAGLISGSVLAVAVAALAGRPMVVPQLAARVAFVLIGILLGAVVTPETLKGMVDWPLSVAILIAAALSMMAATASYLRLVHGWDRLSALMGASPGSLAQVMTLSAEFGLDLRAIAIVQTMRVLVLAVGLPAGLGLFGFTAVPASSPAQAVPAGVGDLGELAVLTLTSTAVALVMQRFRMPGGLLFGALAASGVLHGTGLIHALLPWWMADGAMITLGALAGSRFANTSPRILAGYLGVAFGSFAVAIAVATCFMLVVTSL